MPPHTDIAFEIDSGQDDLSKEITGAYIRSKDQTRIEGKFTCIVDQLAPRLLTTTNLATGKLELGSSLATESWTFESDGFEIEGAVQDSDYMYFGYWLQSPVPHSTNPMDYAFAAFYGGAADGEFALDETHFVYEPHPLDSKI